ncbi:MAG TPA: hypothetical protein VFY90_15075 [Tepidiformaceae bacterium]|nr:hypothetical protein [Tepidiformaceae bacterium]
MKIWELHAMNLRGAIRTTPDDRADVAGLVFSEKAYLLAVRDFRPAELVNLVEREGPHEAARRLVAHFSSEEVLNACGGRGLVAAPGFAVDPVICRSDEVTPVTAGGRH